MLEIADKTTSQGFKDDDDSYIGLMMSPVDDNIKTPSKDIDYDAISVVDLEDKNNDHEFEAELDWEEQRSDLSTAPCNATTPDSTTTGEANASATQFTLNQKDSELWHSMNFEGVMFDKESG